MSFIVCILLGIKLLQLIHLNSLLQIQAGGDDQLIQFMALRKRINCLH